MAEEAVDQAIVSFGFKPQRACQTGHLRLVGAENFEPAGERVLNQTYGFDADVAHHLHHAFATRRFGLPGWPRQGFGARLHARHPYLEAEVLYAVRHEFAERASDVLDIAESLALA